MLTHEVAARLERKLGLGAFPHIRRRTYARLQRLAEQLGDSVLQVIAQVEMEAIGPNVRDKGQYFCFVVKRRLDEAGLVFSEHANPQVLSQLAAIKAELVNSCPSSVPPVTARTPEQMREELTRRHVQEVAARLKARAAAEEGAF